MTTPKNTTVPDSHYAMDERGHQPTASTPAFDMKRLVNGEVPDALGQRVLTANEVSDLATHRAKTFYSETLKPELRGYKEYAFSLGFCKGYEQSRQDHAHLTARLAECERAANQGMNTIRSLIHALETIDSDERGKAREERRSAYVHTTEIKQAKEAHAQLESFLAP